MSRRVSSPAVLASAAALTPAVPRRRSPRLQLLGEVHGHLVGLFLPIVVRDISAGGFSIVTAVEFPRDAVHHFELSVESDTRPPLVVRAQVVHSRMMASDPEVLYVTGFALTSDQPRASANEIAALVESVRQAAEARQEKTPAADGGERRQDERLSVLGALHGEFESLGVPLVVCDFGLGGCSVETHTPLEVGSVQFLRIDVYDSISVTLQARVAHSRRAPGPDRPTRYLTGLQFIDPDRNQVSEMLDLLISSRRA